MRIVILEDDQEQSDLLVAWLEDAGHVCDTFADGASFIKNYAKESYDVVLLDWMVPKYSGLEVLAHLRDKLDSVVPVVFITQRDSEEDIVAGLKAGADDYIIKPVRQAETMARIGAIARRVGFGEKNTADVYELSPYKIDTRLREIYVNGDLIEMTSKEYELTLFLFKNIGRILSRGHLLEMVWGTSSNIHTRTVDTHISRLRTKLNLNNDNKLWRLTSVYQHGYRLENLAAT
jgi:DNA-binding response OmpR family regulator